MRSGDSRFPFLNREAAVSVEGRVAASERASSPTLVGCPGAVWGRANAAPPGPHCWSSEERILSLSNRQQPWGQRGRWFTARGPMPALLPAGGHQACSQVLSPYASFSSVWDDFLWSPNKACFSVYYCLSTNDIKNRFPGPLKEWPVSWLKWWDRSWDIRKN